MRISKRNVTLLLLILLAFSSRAQTSTDSVFYGIEDFILGTSKEYFGDRIKFVDSVAYDGITDYEYAYHSSSRLELAGIDFQSAFLSFNESGKLKRVFLSKLYSERLFANHKSKAAEDYQKIYDLVVSQSGNKGKKKNKFKTIKAQGHEWRKNGAQLWSFVQSSRQPTAKMLYFIVIEWKYVGQSK
jgi:hypothetical protein